MATNFNGSDLQWTPTSGSAISIEIIDVSFSTGESPRVDATHAGSTFKTYLAGIREAFSVTVTSYVDLGNPGDTGSFTNAGNTSITTSHVYRIESAEESGSIDNAVTYATTLYRIS